MAFQQAADADALTTAFSLTDYAVDLLSLDLTDSLQSFAPSGTVFAPLLDELPSAAGDLEALGEGLAPDSLPPANNATANARAAETHWSDSDGSSLTSTGSPADSPPGARRAPARIRQATRGSVKKRVLNYNPNRAREERRKELLGLRDESRALESQLNAMRSVAMRQAASGRVRSPVAASGDSIAQSVWKGIAERQLEKRLHATRENCELKKSARNNAATIRRMERLLRSYNAERATRMLSIARLHELHKYMEFKLDPSLVERLLASVAKGYRDVNKVFQDCDADVSRAVTFCAPRLQLDANGNLMTRVYASKVFPYNVQSTGMAAWTQFSRTVRPIAHCFFTEILQDTEDLVVERFGTELHRNGEKVVVHVRQVKRRYTEAEREVVVWQSVVDPIEFRGQRLEGAAFEERGFFVITRPPNLPSGFSLLQTCYLISPSSPMQSVPQTALALAMTDFVLDWMAATIPVNHQTIEDILLDRSLVSSA